MRLIKSWLAAVVGGVLVSGCSQILPGLNIKEGKVGGHEFAIVAKPEGQGYAVAPADVPLRYEVVPVDAKVVANLLHADTDDAAARALPAVQPSDIPPEYRVGPGDVLFVTVWEHPELTTPEAVQLQTAAAQGRLIASNGTMYYPYIGDFKVAGETAAEIRDFLVEHLRRVIKDPQVDVRVIGFRSRRVQITGAVGSPGTYTLDDTPKGVLQLIDQAGGLSSAASRRRAILVRGGKRYTIDTAGLMSGAYPVPNPRLLPGDVVHIPDISAEQIYMLGAVNSVQPQPLPQSNLTLLQALTNAGGLDKSTASDSGVLVFRVQNPVDQTVPSSATVYALDMGSPRGLLLASQFPLQAHDVVYVKATAFAQYNTIIGQLLPTVTTVFELNQLTK